jgi:hypothetical protein
MDASSWPRTSTRSGTPTRRDSSWTADGRIVEHWGETNALQTMQQVGDL